MSSELSEEAGKEKTQAGKELERLEATKALVERGFISRNRDGSIRMPEEFASGGLIPHLNPDSDYIYERYMIVNSKGETECHYEWRRVA